MRSNSDKRLESLFKDYEQQSKSAPQGLKEDILRSVLMSRKDIGRLSKLQIFFFRRPLAAAGGLAFALSVSLWCVFGNAYLDFLSNLLSGVS